MPTCSQRPLPPVDQVPADLPDRDRTIRVLDPDDGGWLEPGNTVICNPDGKLVAGPLGHAEDTLTTEIDLAQVAEMRQLFDPVGHYPGLTSTSYAQTPASVRRSPFLNRPRP